MEITDREIRHMAICRRVAAEGMVLLENNGALPLDLYGSKIALYGYGARHTVAGGTGSGEVNNRHTVSVEEGLKNAGVRITTSRWLDRLDLKAQSEMEQEIQQLHTEGVRGDALIWRLYGLRKESIDSVLPEDDENQEKETAIYVISRNAGEGSDRKNQPGDYLATDAEIRMLYQLRRMYRRLIVLLNVGGVMDTTFLRQIGPDAVLLMGQPGMAAGDAVTDVLGGKVTPSGHLAATWAAAYEDYPNADRFSGLSGDTDDEYYTEGIYVGYRWFDTRGKKSAYPFGFGRSYTSFSMEKESLTLEGEAVHLKVKVTNTGTHYCGKAVAQLYVSAPEGKIEKPYQELKAYAKTRLLHPGETETLDLTLEPGDMASWDDKRGVWVLEAGDYLLRLGQNAEETEVCGILRLEEERVSETYTARITPDVPLKMMHLERKRQEMVCEAAAEILILRDVRMLNPVSFEEEQETGFHPAEMLTMEDLISDRCTVKEFVHQLTEGELARLCLGIARDGVDESSVIGAASQSCPGGAGETTAVLMESRQVPNLILADGPAGLRLAQEFMLDADGHVIWESAPFGQNFSFLLPQNQKPNHPDAKHMYQFASAIPTATVLAQTWNPEAIRECGDLVGAEMTQFGIALWLAPGMNIQRNPLCGRNFEYYSEDPLLSGCCAAAMTEGVQAHPGAGTTIKHFACNNQEDNRNFNNSHVSERALREIYLKGFEIAIRKAQPLAVMSSYNLLNGTHTANLRTLLTEIARNEWGFRGLVMTDWCTTSQPEPDENGRLPKYPCSDPVLCIKAGNDLIMPGSRADLNAIAAAVYHDLSIEELRTCAEHVMRVITKMQKDIYRSKMDSAEQKSD